MKDLLRVALRLADADYCEVRFEDSSFLGINFRGSDLEQLAQEIQSGGNVRAFFKGAWGFAAFEDPDELPAMIETACRQAKLAGERKAGQSRLAKVPAIEAEFAPKYTLDPRAVALDEKVRILAGYQDLILGYHPSITAVSIVYKEKASILHFANSEGTYLKQEKIDIGANLSAIACRDDITVTNGIGCGGSRGFDSMLNQDEALKQACDIAVKLLDAPQVKAGVYTVVCDPHLTWLFTHEAFGHLSEADFACRNPGLANAMTLGRKLGRDILTIYDTGEYYEGRGALQYDDEGTSAERSYLIKDGILVGRLHSRETAGIMGEKPTGSARALDYTYPPICRMRGTCIAPGESSFQDMIKDIKLGVYAIGGAGGETNGEMFTFNAGYGYMIRDGQIAELVKDVKLMGNVFTTLANIDMIGQELKVANNAGGCGKNDQVPLPVSGKCPPIRIQNVIVGGGK